MLLQSKTISDLHVDPSRLSFWECDKDTNFIMISEQVIHMRGVLRI